MKATRLALFASILSASGVEYSAANKPKQYGAELLEEQKRRIDESKDRDHPNKPGGKE